MVADCVNSNKNKWCDVLWCTPWAKLNVQINVMYLSAVAALDVLARWTCKCINIMKSSCYNELNWMHSTLKHIDSNWLNVSGYSRKNKREKCADKQMTVCESTQACVYDVGTLCFSTPFTSTVWRLTEENMWPSKYWYLSLEYFT